MNKLHFVITFLCTIGNVDVQILLLLVAVVAKEKNIYVYVPELGL